MTYMIIDNKANTTPAYEMYEIDRNEYQTETELHMLVGECMNENVYLIRMIEDGKELFTSRNWR